MSVYTLPELPYDYAALEPHISGRIMAFQMVGQQGTVPGGAIPAA